MSKNRKDGNVIDVDFKEVKGEEMNEEMKNTEVNEEVETNDEQKEKKWTMKDLEELRKKDEIKEKVKKLGKKVLIGVAAAAVVGGGLVVIKKIMKGDFEDKSVDVRTVKDEVTEAVKEVIVTEN